MSQTVCRECGAFGDMPHGWIEGTCILPHKGHSKATVGFVCAGCVDHHRGWLTEIVELYATLGQVIDPGAIPDDTAEHQHVKKKPASPAPMRLGAWAMLNDQARLGVVTVENGVTSPAYLGNALPDIPTVLAGWADHLWELLGYGSDAPDTVTGAAVALTSNAETIARSPLVDDYDAELRWLRKALRDAHGVTDEKPLGDCLTVTDGQDCPGKVMPSPTGDGRPKCTACRRSYAEKDLVTLSIMESRKRAARARQRPVAPVQPPRQDGEPNVQPVIHSGRSGVDQAIVVPGDHRGTLSGTMYTDERDAG